MNLDIPLSLVGWSVVAAEVLGIFSAVHAIMSVRTSQGAIAWVVCLVTFPVLSLPLYWIFGRNHFFGYVEAIREGLATHNLKAEDIIALLERDASVPRAELPPELKLYEKLAASSFTRSNSPTLLVDGHETFSKMFTDIEDARKYVLIQYYIIKDDTLGRQLKEMLIRKARQGVRVFVLYDEIGSHALPMAYDKELLAAGARISGFKTTRGKGNRLQINFRNHRKVTVVDGKVAYVGGHNIGDEYMGRDPKIGRWRDTHVRAEGPVARNVQASFLQDWYWATREIPSLEWPVWDEKAAGGAAMLSLATGPADELESCSLMFVHAISSAKSRIWISSPYFVPDIAVVAALQAAALRGVDVRILFPEKVDHLVVYLAGFTYLPQLDMPGITFYRYNEGFLHQKAFLVDDTLAGIGTANLDNRSFRLNFEITMLAADKNFAGQVYRMFNEDFSCCSVTSSRDYLCRGLPFRLAAKMARLLAPVL